MRDICLTGLPGCGKGTLARAFVDAAGGDLVAVATGDIARRISAESARSGAMAPEDLLRSELLMAIDAARPAGGAVVVDGLPRKPEQVGWAQEHLIDPLFVFLDTAPEECERRLIARGRADDTPVYAKMRLTEQAALLEQVLGVWDADWHYMEGNDRDSALGVLAWL